LPSLTPVSSSSALFLSITSTLEIASAERFFKTIDGSPPKNSLPSTNIFEISFPCAITLPSKSTSTPGNLFSNSSIVSSCLTLKELAL